MATPLPTSFTSCTVREELKKQLHRATIDVAEQEVEIQELVCALRDFDKQFDTAKREHEDALTDAERIVEERTLAFKESQKQTEKLAGDVVNAGMKFLQALNQASTQFQSEYDKRNERSQTRKKEAQVAFEQANQTFGRMYGQLYSWHRAWSRGYEDSLIRATLGQKDIEQLRIEEIEAAKACYDTRQNKATNRAAIDEADDVVRQILVGIHAFEQPIKDELTRIQDQITPVKEEHERYLALALAARKELYQCETKVWSYLDQKLRDGRPSSFQYPNVIVTEKQAEAYVAFARQQLVHAEQHQRVCETKSELERHQERFNVENKRLNAIVQASEKWQLFYDALLSLPAAERELWDSREEAKVARLEKERADSVRKIVYDYWNALPHEKLKYFREPHRSSISKQELKAKIAALQNPIPQAHRFKKLVEVLPYLDERFDPDTAHDKFVDSAERTDTERYMLCYLVMCNKPEHKENLMNALAVLQESVLHLAGPEDEYTTNQKLLHESNTRTRQMKIQPNVLIDELIRKRREYEKMLQERRVSLEELNERMELAKKKYSLWISKNEAL